MECNYTATAAAGYQFDGWYNLMGEKVSDQATYTVEAQTSLTLVAKFQEETQHTHTVTLVKGTPATCTQPGVKDYYQCDCGAVFEDEAMTKPTTEPTPAPTQEPQESQKPETTDKPQATEDPGKVPPTGDASQLMLYVAALAGATLLLGTAAVARKRRG